MKSSTNNSTWMTCTWGAGADYPIVRRRVLFDESLAGGLSDFDGDHKRDVTVYRPSTGTWLTVLSTSGGTTPTSTPLGGASDIPVSNDYDGDGITDEAVFNTTNGVWSILRSGTTPALTTFTLGGANDKPVPGDYDGDGIADAAVFTPSTGVWSIRLSTTGSTVTYT